MGCWKKKRKKLVVDPGDWKVSVSHYNLKPIFSEIFRANILRLLQSVSFFGIFSLNFAYDPSSEEMIALNFLPVNLSALVILFKLLQGWGDFKKQQLYCSNGLLAHLFYKRKNFEGTSIGTKKCLHSSGKDYEEGVDEIMDTPFFEPFGKEVEYAEKTQWLFCMMNWLLTFFHFSTPIYKLLS